MAGVGIGTGRSTGISASAYLRTQLPIVAGRQIVTNFPDLIFDNVVIVEQPFGRRRRGAPLAGRTSDAAVCFEENRLVVPQPEREGSAGYLAPGDMLGPRDARARPLPTGVTHRALAGLASRIPP